MCRRNKEFYFHGDQRSCVGILPDCDPHSLQCADSNSHLPSLLHQAASNGTTCPKDIQCAKWSDSEVCLGCHPPYILNKQSHCQLQGIFSNFHAYPGRSLDCCWLQELTQISDAECAERCMNHANCTGFSYGLRNCYLKSGVATTAREQWCRDTRCIGVIHFERKSAPILNLHPNLDAETLTRFRSEALPLLPGRDFVHVWDQKVCILQRKIWLLDEEEMFPWTSEAQSLYIDHFYGQEIQIGRPEHVSHLLGGIDVNARYGYFLPDDYMHHLWHSLTPLLTTFDVLIQFFGMQYRHKLDVIWVSSPKDKTQNADYNRDMDRFLHRFHMLLTARVPIYFFKPGRGPAADECWYRGLFGRPLVFNEPGSTMKLERYSLFPELMRKQLGVDEVPKFFPTPPKGEKRWNVLVIHRDGARAFHNERDVQHLIASDDRFQLQTQDLGNLTLEEQASVVFESDVVIGSHGQALTWVVLLKPGSVLMELLSEGAWMCIRKRLDWYTNYRFLAKQFGIHHMCWLDKRVGPDNLNWKKSEVNITLDRLSHSLERSVELNEGFSSKQNANAVCGEVSIQCNATELFCSTVEVKHRLRIFLQFTLFRHQSSHTYARIETGGEEIRLEDKHRRIGVTRKREIISTANDIKTDYEYDIEIDFIFPNYISIWADGVYERTRTADFDFGRTFRFSLCGGDSIDGIISKFMVSVDF